MGYKDLIELKNVMSTTSYFPLVKSF